MSVTTLTGFHHWLLAEDTFGAPFIVLQAPEGRPLNCAETVSHLLNEFDEESRGNWIAITPQIVYAIAADPAQRRLLGVADGCGKCPPTSLCGLRKILTTIARRGHVVFNDPLALEATLEEPGGFRASIGFPIAAPECFHMILNPSHFQARCLAPLIADSFLEWSASRQHLPAA